MPRQMLGFFVVEFCIACRGLFMEVAEHHKNLKSWHNHWHLSIVTKINLSNMPTSVWLYIFPASILFSKSHII